MSGLLWGLTFKQFNIFWMNQMPPKNAFGQKRIRTKDQLITSLNKLRLYSHE